MTITPPVAADNRSLDQARERRTGQPARRWLLLSRRERELRRGVPEPSARLSCVTAVVPDCTSPTPVPRLRHPGSEPVLEHGAGEAYVATDAQAREGAGADGFVDPARLD